jgi:hypothetical protein
MPADFEAGPAGGAGEGDAWFGQEYMCEFSEVEGRAFSRESIDAALQDFEAMEL